VVGSGVDPAAARHPAGMTTAATAADHRLQTPPSFPREDERVRLDDLVRAASARAAGALRVIGEDGIGKSAALDYAAKQLTGFRVLRIRGVAAEHDLPYAGLQLMCAPVLDGGPELPAAHRDALAAAVGLTGGPRPEVTVVGFAVLDLLIGIAESQPLCLLVDDAHRLDEQTVGVLAFVARRIDRHALLLLLAEDSRDRLDQLDGLPEMRLRPLSRPESRALLAAIAPGPIDDIVAERVLAESRGNPRALTEAFRGITAAELAGGFGIPLVRRSCALGHDCLDRARQLLPGARRLLLAAAADPTGDADLLRRVAGGLGTGPETVELLTARGLLVVADRVTFACPGLRSAAYFSATAEERRGVHRELARSTIDDPARRAWHLGLAATGGDNTLADELERCAGPAQSRGGTAAGAAFLERAALLTADPTRRADRALTAASAMCDAGDPGAAQRLLAVAEAGPGSSVRLAHAAWHRARIEAVTRGGAGSAQQLLDAALRLLRRESTVGREALLEALLAAMSANTSAAGATMVEAARAARAAAAAHRSHPVDLMLYGIATRVLDGYTGSVNPLRTAIAAFRDSEPDPRTTRWLGLAGLVAADLWDEPTWLALASRYPTGGRRADPVTPVGEGSRGAPATPSVGPIETSWVRTVAVPVPGLPAGFTLDCSELSPSARQCRSPGLQEVLSPAEHHTRGHGTAPASAVAVAVLHNGSGRYEEAVEAAREAIRAEEPGITGRALMELVEAAARSGRPETAADAAARLAERTTAAGTDWALGVQAMAQALLVDEEHAEPRYQEALGRLVRTGIRGELARAQLLYGEWLRRRNRRIDARTQLRAARDLFIAVGASAFADRAQRELLATGEAARKRTIDSKRQLTPQEARVAYLAREGLSNPQIAARLFLSRRTVEYHLQKAFAKLAITSRAKLHLVLDPEPDGG